MVIRALTASEAFQLRVKDMQSTEIFGLVSMSIVEPVLSADDIGMLPTSIISELTKEICAFNGLGSKAVDEAVAELKKTDVLTSSSAAS